MAGILNMLAYGGAQGLTSALAGIAKDYFQTKNLTNMAMKKSILEDLVNVAQTGTPEQAAKVRPFIEQLSGITLPTTQVTTKPAEYNTKEGYKVGLLPGANVANYIETKPAETAEVPLLGTPSKLEPVLAATIARNAGLGEEVVRNKFVRPNDIRSLIAERRYGEGGLEELGLGIKGRMAGAAERRAGAAEQSADTRAAVAGANIPYLKAKTNVLNATTEDKVANLKAMTKYYNERAGMVKPLAEAEMGKLQQDVAHLAAMTEAIPLNAETKALHESVQLLMPEIMTNVAVPESRRGDLLSAISDISKKLADVHGKMGKIETKPTTKGKAAGKTQLTQDEINALIESLK